MSFGFSPSDIFTLITVVTKSYKGWRDACGEYTDITSSLKHLLSLVRQVQDEVKNEHSILLRTSKDKAILESILRSCKRTTEELGSVIEDYRTLGQGKSRERNWVDLQKNWKRFTFGNKDLDGLRAKLQQHVNVISAHLAAAGVSSLSRVEWDIKALPDQIQRSVDGLAAEIRAGRREGSVMTTYEDDEKDVWRQLRRELIGEGMRSSTIHQFKPRIKNYLRTLAEEGLLEEQAPVAIDEANSCAQSALPVSSPSSPLPATEREEDSDEVDPSDAPGFTSDLLPESLTKVSPSLDSVLVANAGHSASNELAENHGHEEGLEAMPIRHPTVHQEDVQNLKDALQPTCETEDEDENVDAQGSDGDPNFSADDPASDSRAHVRIFVFDDSGNGIPIDAKHGQPSESLSGEDITHGKGAGREGFEVQLGPGPSQRSTQKPDAGISCYRRRSGYKSAGDSEYWKRILRDDYESDSAEQAEWQAAGYATDEPYQPQQEASNQPAPRDVAEDDSDEISQWQQKLRTEDEARRLREAERREAREYYDKAYQLQQEEADKRAQTERREAREYYDKVYQRQQEEADKKAEERRAAIEYYERKYPRQREETRGPIVDQRARRIFASSAVAADYYKSLRSQRRSKSSDNRSSLRIDTAKEQSRTKDGRPIRVRSSRRKTKDEPRRPPELNNTRSSPADIHIPPKHEPRRPPGLSHTRSSPADINLPTENQ